MIYYYEKNALHGWCFRMEYPIALTAYGDLRFSSRLFGVGDAFWSVPLEGRKWKEAGRKRNDKRDGDGVVRCIVLYVINTYILLNHEYRIYM